MTRRKQFEQNEHRYVFTGVALDKTGGTLRRKREGKEGNVRWLTEELAVWQLWWCVPPCFLRWRAFRAGSNWLQKQVRHRAGATWLARAWRGGGLPRTHSTWDGKQWVVAIDVTLLPREEEDLKGRLAKQSVMTTCFKKRIIQYV